MGCILKGYSISGIWSGQGCGQLWTSGSAYFFRPSLKSRALKIFGECICLINRDSLIDIVKYYIPNLFDSPSITNMEVSKGENDVVK